jgi:lipopolysaccharide export LptBFGC system permease protein LptF
VKATQRQVKENIRQINEHVARDLYRWFGTTFGVAGSAMDSIFAQSPFYPLSYIAQYDPGNLKQSGPGSPVEALADSTRSSAARKRRTQADSHPNLTAKDSTQQRRQKLAHLLSHERQILYNLDTQLSIMRSFERTSDGLLVEIHKKYSIPVACLVFVVIGAPLGFMARRGGIATGGGLSLGFFLLYWTFLIGGEDLADRQLISPFLAMWSANFVVGAAGLYLLWRVAKESLTLDFRKLLRWRRKSQ